MLREQLEGVLDTLTPREEQVLRLRFGLDDGRARTLEEVGQVFGVTRERIGRSKPRPFASCGIQPEEEAEGLLGMRAKDRPGRREESHPRAGLLPLPGRSRHRPRRGKGCPGRGRCPCVPFAGEKRAIRVRVAAWGLSSRSEQLTHNRLVQGSSP